jgi:hypothetical protein
VAASSGAFAWTDISSLDSAVTQTLSPGGYTMVVTGASGDTGVALAEVYDATPQGAFLAGSSHLTNVSARAQVGTDGNILIVGLTIAGSTSRTVLIRASGPSLAEFGVPGVLPDPRLSLYSMAAPEAPMATSLAWGGSDAVSRAAAGAGAFIWSDSSSADSALLVTLPPGSYTAQVAGASGDTGVALLEVYEIP